MGTQAFTITILIICGICYALALFQIPKRRFKLGLGIIILCGLVLRFYMAADFQLNEWDESYHALVAKNMMNDLWHPTLYINPIMEYDFKDWTGNHTWLHSQPLPLWASALSMQMFGVNEISFRLPSILLSIVSLLLMYYLTKELFSKLVAIWATFFFSIHYMLIEFVAGRVTPDHFEVFFICFFLAGVYFSVLFFNRGKWWWNVFAGLSIGLAYLSNAQPAIFVVFLWLVFAIFRRKKEWLRYFLNLPVLLAAALLVILPWQIHIYTYFPQEALWEAKSNFFKFFIYDQNHFQPYYFYFLNSLPQLFGSFVVIPIVWYVYHAIIKPNQPTRWLISLWILLPIIVYSFAATKMNSYIMLISPAIFMLMGVFMLYMYLKAQVMHFKMLGYGLCAFTLIFPLIDTVQRFSPQENVNKNPNWVIEMKEVGELMPKQEKTVIFNVERATDLMFYTDCIAYNYELSDSTKVLLLRKGYTVYDNFQDAYQSVK